MKQIVYAMLTIAAVGYLGICAALFFFQRSLIYFPQPRAVTSAESTLRLPVEDAQLVVTVRPYAGPKAIVYFGGNGEDVSLNLASFSQWFPDHALYFLHYRGYGGSTGSPSEQANTADAAALFAKVQAEHPEVLVIGRSLGTGVAVQLVSQHPAARLILVTPFDSIEEIAAASFPYIPVSQLLRDRYASGKYAPAIHTPTTLIAAEHDETIPRASTDKLLGRFPKGVATMTVIPGAGHNTVQDQDAYRLALQGT